MSGGEVLFTPREKMGKGEIIQALRIQTSPLQTVAMKILEEVFQTPL